MGPTTSTLPSLPQSRPSKPRAPHRRRDPDHDPAVVHDTIDGEAVVRVELFGKGAAGRSMILDAKDWRSISRRWGVHWICYASSKGSVYVGSGRRAPASQAKQSGPAPTALLSRIITKAPPKAVVTYRNGDRLDLRRGNLEVTTRREVTRRRLEGLAEQTIH